MMNSHRQRRSWALASPFCVVVLTAVAQGRAQARAVSPQDDASPNVVMLLPGRSDATSCASDLEAIQNQLADIPTSVELVPLGAAVTQTDAILEAAQQIAAARSAVLVFWAPFDSRSLRQERCATADRVYLFTPDAEGGRFLVRDLGDAPPGSEAQREALGVIVRATLRALILGERLEGSPMPSVPGPTEPETVTDVPPPYLVMLAQYGLWGLSDQIPIGHGARLGVEVAARRITAGLGWRLQAVGKTRWSSIEVRRHSGGPEVYAAWGLGIRVRFEIEVAFFIERNELEVEAQQQDAQIPSGAARWVPTVGGSLGVSVPAGDRLRLAAAVGADIPWERTRYVIKEGEIDHLALEGWLVRPTFRMGGFFSIVNLLSVRR